MKRSVGRDAGRFVLAGLGNTLLTLALYQLLLLLLSPRLAYAVTWLAGITLVAIFYPSRVFGVAAPGAATRIGVTLVYAAGFILGLVMLPPANELLGERLGVVPVIGLTTAFNFVLMRLVINASRQRD